MKAQYIPADWAALARDDEELAALRRMLELRRSSGTVRNKYPTIVWSQPEEFLHNFREGLWTADCELAKPLMPLDT